MIIKESNENSIVYKALEPLFKKALSMQPSSPISTSFSPSSEIPPPSPLPPGVTVEKARLHFNVGEAVVISPGSGVLSNRTGTIISPSEVKTDGRGIPTNVQGVYKPVDWKKEVAIRLDSGEIITMYKTRILPSKPK